ncbi:hypothetical protein LPJ78_002675 [Coemansia sp. RSA 989]|nr:hypothetical protein LPJ78_002675 [Coemansia sp. RSA 989]KAJ2676563.1 hypothetical protein IWW42_000438 [Coemansia sp. RSA 1085]
MATMITGWTPEAELALYLSMVGLRPVGIHRHFRVLNIYTRLQHRLGKTADISLTDMKNHIDSLFNMPLLDEIEDDYEEDEDAERTSAEADEAEAQPAAIARQDPHLSDHEPAEDHNSEHSDSDKDSSKEGKRAARIETRPSLSEVIPPTSFGASIDSSDPQFWRKKNEFSLPWSEFGTLMVEKAGVGVNEDDASDAPRVNSPEPSKANPESESSDGQISPVARRRRGRSSTPVQRNRTKTTRSAASSARKRQKAR